MIHACHQINSNLQLGFYLQNVVSMQQIMEQTLLPDTLNQKFLLKAYQCQAWWYMPLMPELSIHRQLDL